MEHQEWDADDYGKRKGKPRFTPYTLLGTKDDPAVIAELSGTSNEVPRGASVVDLAESRDRRNQKLRAA